MLVWFSVRGLITEKRNSSNDHTCSPPAFRALCSFSDPCAGWRVLPGGCYRCGDGGHSGRVSPRAVGKLPVSPPSTVLAWGASMLGVGAPLLFNVELLSKWMLNVVKCLSRFPSGPRSRSSSVPVSLGITPPWQLLGSRQPLGGPCGSRGVGTRALSAAGSRKAQLTAQIKGTCCSRRRRPRVQLHQVSGRGPPSAPCPPGPAAVCGRDTTQAAHQRRTRPWMKRTLGGSFLEVGSPSQRPLGTVPVSQWLHLP